jgi:metallo-beta-lactamase class B
MACTQFIVRVLTSRKGEAMRSSFVSLIGLAVSIGGANAASLECSKCAEWNQDQTPFQVFGNTYYVGTRGLSAVLITSPQGHVLIDGALPQSAPLIATHIEQLGFKVTDVKAILNSHVHVDHAGGIAELQKRSGARVIASDIGARALASGKSEANDPQFALLPAFDAVSNVQALGSQTVVTVGKLTLSVVHTPGHTPGGTTWTWKSCEGERCLNVVYGDSLNAASDDTFKYSGDARYPRARADMSASIAAVDTMPCDILIAAHPELTALWSVFDAHGKGDRTKLIDASACKRYAGSGKTRFEQRLKSEH